MTLVLQTLICSSGHSEENYKGIVLYSPGALGSEFANAAFYLDLKEHGNTYLATPLSGSSIRILRNEFIQDIPLDFFDKDLKSDSERTAWVGKIDGLKALAAKFPTGYAVINQAITRAQTMVDRYDAGERFALGVWYSKADFLARSTQMAGANELQTSTGRTLVNPKFQRVDGENAVISHQGGFARVRIEHLPAEFVAKWNIKSEGAMSTAAAPAPVTEPQVETQAQEAPEKTPSNWKPEELDDVLKCVVFIEGDRGQGTGFFCKVDGITYVYTNMHVLAGNTRLKITDRDGNEFREFVYAESAAGGFDNGDVVRLAMKKGREKALTLRSDEDIPANNSEIVAVGNSQGSGVLRTLDGKVLGVGPTRIEISAEIVQGNSGGPIVDENFDVIGISSFGEYRIDIWSEGTDFDGVRRFGLRPEKISSWDRYGVIELMKIAYSYDQMIADIALVTVMNAISFSTEGLIYDANEEITAGMNANEIVEAFKGHAFADALLNFNDRLEGRKRTGNAGLDARSMLVEYATLFSEGQLRMQVRRQQVLGMKSVPLFIRDKLKNHEVLEAHKEKEKDLFELAVAINDIL